MYKIELGGVAVLFESGFCQFDGFDEVTVERPLGFGVTLGAGLPVLPQAAAAFRTFDEREFLSGCGFVHRLHKANLGAKGGGWQFHRRYDY